MKREVEVKRGDVVRVTVEVWSEGETSTYLDFYTGKIIEIVECRESCSYVRILGLDKLIPIEGVIAPLK